jgi:hydrogenase maturation protease
MSLSENNPSNARPASRRAGDPPWVLVVGYGNPLRCDDGVGWVVAERIEELMVDECSYFTPEGPGVKVITCHQLTPELAAEFAQFDLVILIDACVDLPPGQSRWCELTAQANGPADTHQVGAGALLSLSQSLYGRTPRALLLTIGGQEWGLGGELSAAVSEAANRAVDQVKQRIAAAERLHA